MAMSDLNVGPQRIRVYVAGHLREPDELAWFERQASGYMTGLDASRLESEGFVEGVLDPVTGVGLLESPMVAWFELVPANPGGISGEGVQSSNL